MTRDQLQTGRSGRIRSRSNSNAKRAALRALVINIAILSLLGISCNQALKSRPPQRDFYPDTGEAVRTDFTYSNVLDYSAIWFGTMGIATGGETKFAQSNTVILRSTLMALDPRARLLTFKSAYLKNGNVLITADVVRDLGCRVISVIFSNAFRSEYYYGSITQPIPSIKTTDVATGKVLSITGDVEIQNDGTFRVQEIDYQDDHEVFKSVARRNSGTGLLIGEEIKHGVLERDYHHYELTLDRWSGCEPKLP